MNIEAINKALQRGKPSLADRLAATNRAIKALAAQIRAKRGAAKRPQQFCHVLDRNGKKLVRIGSAFK